MKDVQDVLRTVEIAIRQCSNAEIEERLIQYIFDAASLRLGTERAQQIFGKLSSDTYANDLAARKLVLVYLSIGQRNKEQFVRQLAEHNKQNLPRSQQRGAGSTNVTSLRRYLNKMLIRYRDYIATSGIAELVGDPLADRRVDGRDAGEVGALIAAIWKNEGMDHPIFKMVGFEDLKELAEIWRRDGYESVNNYLRIAAVLGQKTEERP